jgi:hypothetical protein
LIERFELYEAQHGRAFSWSSTYTLISLIFIGSLRLSHSLPLTQQI